MAGLFAIRRAALQHKALVAIAAFDKALVINLEPHARVAEGSAAGNIGRAIARDAVAGDADGFRSLDHGWADSNGAPASQGSN